ncbi:MAG: PfkB family carbohydrate kinase [Isosphaeraceae bacterium]
MTPERFQELTSRYGLLGIAVVGDVCLDRYLEIDPERAEVSIETGLPVHNVVRVRAQPGGAGTVINNLAALGVGAIIPITFLGDDGEGFELRRGLAGVPGLVLDHVLTTSERRTFTYCKPLVVAPGQAPVELNRLDSKNWSPTPERVETQLIRSLHAVLPSVDAVVVLEQVDRLNTGVTTTQVLSALGELSADRPVLPVLADSRRGLRDWPRLSFKMNAAELSALLGREDAVTLEEVTASALELAKWNARPVFVTLAERGIVATSPDGRTEHVRSLPLRGPIDVVGAGDSVTANLATALAAGATIHEAITLAAIASSVVIHQLGTTGTASVPQLADLLPLASTP